MITVSLNGPFLNCLFPYEKGGWPTSSPLPGCRTTSCPDQLRPNLLRLLRPPRLLAPTLPTYLIPTQPSTHHSREVLILTLPILIALKQLAQSTYILITQPSSSPANVCGFLQPVFKWLLASILPWMFWPQRHAFGFASQNIWVLIRTKQGMDVRQTERDQTSYFPLFVCNPMKPKL